MLLLCKSLLGHALHKGEYNRFILEGDGLVDRVMDGRRYYGGVLLQDVDIGMATELLDLPLYLHGCMIDEEIVLVFDFVFVFIDPGPEFLLCEAFFGFE